MRTRQLGMDMMMALFLALGAVVYILLPLIADPLEKSDEAPQPQGNLIIELYWPDEQNIDVDLWARAEADGIPIGYSNKGGAVFNLLRDAAIHIMGEIVQRLLEKHEKLTVRTLRGNHDLNSHKVLKFAFCERYRNEPRITVDMTPHELFMKQWGRSAIFSHHGDKGKPERMALYISDICPFWSETKHRHYFVGHVHHDNAKDICPLRYESLRAFCPPDAYAAGMGYGPRRALQAITFHNNDGIVLRALDPIERHP